MKDGETQLRACWKCGHYPPNADTVKMKCPHRIWMLKERDAQDLKRIKECWTPPGCLKPEGEAGEEE